MTIADTPASSDRLEALAVELSAPVNLRDLGGTPVRDGEIRPGFAIRADDLSYVTDEVAVALVEAGLSTVIDLRSNVETRITGRGPLADHAVTYHHVSLMSDLRSAVSSDDLLSGDYREVYVPMYVSLFERSAPLLVNALAVMATAPGTVAFHCAAGKDRTGVLAASLLLALGADDDTIVDDYARTGPNVDAIMARTRAVVTPMLRAMGVELDAAVLAASERAFDAEAMRGTLRALRERHDGDALAPVRAAGLDDSLVEMLRGRALA
ncbi:tyrosine-protein phosphatase [Microbacterium marinilacus]|uniref:Tyrosine-protein phosphatase n=1 Tax=Microbacterium marinilacus TaxID=415209 RepID=A0ABP7BN78_9MICO|nr:tyrosine-protein phosphatase [Microbacterium marinilacus]MBY0689884.1 tyrosine-protein phosphatase [Microbacterium marinilacus]